MFMTWSWWKLDWKIKVILPDVELDMLYSSPLPTSKRKRCTFLSVLEERWLQPILYSYFQCITKTILLFCSASVSVKTSCLQTFSELYVPGNFYAVCLKGFNSLVRNGNVYAVYSSFWVTVHKTAIYTSFQDSYGDWNILHKGRRSS